jgi:hypothetical protein
VTEDICFWSVGDGEFAWMLQSLVHSFREVGIREDFHLFSDRKISGAITHFVKSFDKRGYRFKFDFLQQELIQLDYQYFIYLDADTIFVRNPGNLIELMHQSPLHFFLETNCILPTKRKEWWNCPIHKYVQMMRTCGVTTEHIYNLNSGLFILQKKIIPIACDLALDFWRYAYAEGYYFPDEPPWAYAMHMLCDLPEKHLLQDHLNIWCSDWTGEWANSLPNGKSWTFRGYMNDETYQVNPAIVHALRSKPLLVRKGKRL